MADLGGAQLIVLDNADEVARESARRVIAEGPPARVLTPDNLLETFGIAFHRIEDRLIVSEAHHVHDDVNLPPHQH